MINYIEGDLFNSKADVIVLPFCLTFAEDDEFISDARKHFPNNYKHLRELTQRCEVALENIFPFDDKKTIINFPVRRRHGQPTIMPWLIKGLGKLRQYIVQNGVKSIAIPALGTGRGTLPWYKVKALFERAFKDFDCEIELYLPRNMALEYTEDDIVGKECKHAICRINGRNDLILVKESIHLKDKRVIPNVELIENYQRPFWYTKKGFQNHQDKKEWEDINRLDKYMINQAQLVEKIGMISGAYVGRNSLRQMANDPYLYGADITNTAILKRWYQDFYKLRSYNSLAVLDIETDVVNRTGEIICISLSFKDKLFMCATKDFIGDIDNAAEKLKKAYYQYLGEYQQKFNTTVEVIITDTPGQACYEVIQRAHDWRPDFIGIWNINFDLKKIIAALKKEKYDIGEVFSDPLMPEGYRYGKYIEGQAVKVKADGTKSSRNSMDIWHTMDCAASFYFIDNMTVYKLLRTAKGNESSYKLNDVLNSKLGLKKLHFDEILEKKAPHLAGLDSTYEWHVFMQKHCKIEYAGAYNPFDCIGVELLDLKEGDIRIAISALGNHSDYANFSQQPRMLVDDMHFECLEDNWVIGTTGSNMRTEIDKKTLPLKGWIVTLPAFLCSDEGLTVAKELPDTPSLIYSHVADLDMERTYPEITSGWNLCKETTYREMCAIEGLTTQQVQHVAVNMVSGKMNAYELCRVLYGAPSFDDLLDEFKRQKNL